ncbi:unnamed protein product [Withania somnifera]
MASKGKGKKKGKGSSKKTENRAPNPNINSTFKPEIISNILSRLNVKSLLRFKRVCNQWRKLISKSDFIATHFRHSSLHSSVIVQTLDEDNYHTLARFKPTDRSLVELNNPFPCASLNMSITGPVNGILCIFRPIWGDVLTLWNPAMSMSKMVKLSETKAPQGMTLVSVGLAFDSQKDDLLILRIFSVRPSSGSVLSKAEFEVRPMKSPLGWKKLKSDIYFYIDRNSSDAICKGEPYWLAYITPTPIVGKYEALVRFNVDEMDFEWLPLPSATAGNYNMYPVNFKDSLGMLIWDGRDNSCIDIWVMDEDQYDWSKIWEVPLSGIRRILGCLRNGDIVAENEVGLLLFYSSSEVVVQSAENTYPCLSIVGPVNGYLCLVRPTWHNVITLWNQEERQCWMVKLSGTKYPQKMQNVVSVGLAFDSQENDLLILRIFCSSTVPNHVKIEILSRRKSTLGWKILKSNMRFCIDRRYTCDAIYKGKPYWLAYIADTPVFGQHDGLVRFDVGKMEFHWLPLPFIRAGYYIKYLVTFEYSLGMLTWEERDKCYIDVWTMDDEEYNWSKKYKVEPCFGIDRILGSLRCGDIVAEKYSRMPIQIDPVTCPAKTKLDLRNAAKGSYVIFDCAESLLLIEGMVPVKTQDLSEYKRLLRESRDFMQTL